MFSIGLIESGWIDRQFNTGQLLETGQTNCSHSGSLAGTGQKDNAESDSTTEFKPKVHNWMQ